MKLAAKILIVISLLNMAVFTGCGDEDADPKYKLKVMGTNGDFAGWYSVDGEDNVYFSSVAVAGTPYYSFEESISSLDSLYVSVGATTVFTSALSIYLYVDSDLVDSAEVTQSEATVKISLTMDYSETEDTTE